MPHMRRKLLFLLALLALSQVAVPAPADQSRRHPGVRAEASARESGPLNLLLIGSSGPDRIRVTLSADGQTYVIYSSNPLQADGEVCWNSEDQPDVLACEAKVIAGITFRGGAGDDVATIGRRVPVPTTLRGEAGDDKLTGGTGSDELRGGIASDTLLGRGGDDALYGGPGEDTLIGGSGEARCVGGSGADSASSCERERGVP